MSQWIKCSEQMPEEGEDVIICFVCNGLRQMHVGFYYQELDFTDWTVYSHKESCLDEVTVTHWMPLPEWPQE